MMRHPHQYRRIAYATVAGVLDDANRPIRLAMQRAPELDTETMNAYIPITMVVEMTHKTPAFVYVNKESTGYIHIRLHTDIQAFEEAMSRTKTTASSPTRQGP